MTFRFAQRAEVLVYPHRRLGSSSSFSSTTTTPHERNVCLLVQAPTPVAAMNTTTTSAQKPGLCFEHGSTCYLVSEYLERKRHILLSIDSIEVEEHQYAL